MSTVSVEVKPGVDVFAIISISSTSSLRVGSHVVVLGTPKVKATVVRAACVCLVLFTAPANYPGGV